MHPCCLLFSFVPEHLQLYYAGDLLFYDFGMMGEIVPDVRTRLLDVFYGVYRKDTDQVLRCVCIRCRCVLAFWEGGLGAGICLLRILRTCTRCVYV